MTSYRLVGTTLIREGYAGMQIESDSHFAEELLEKYAVGQLADGQDALIEEHLLICLECQVRLTDIDDYARDMKVAMAELKTGAAPWRRRLPEWIFGRSGRGLFSIPVPVWVTGLTILAVALLIPHWQVSAVPSEISLSASRGAHTGLMAHASAHGKIRLKIDAASVPPSSSYQLQVVDASGREIWRTNLSPQNDEILAPIPMELPAGRYWVRLSTASDLKLLQEYGLAVD
jgi:anti-sigma factor RsiW